VNGKRYRDLAAPLHEVGALLEARAVHTGRSGYNHLLALAQTHGIPRSRVNEVIELVGLESVANKRVGAFSLGMGQRLGVAAALLGDPATVILDEPANGLDPEGIRWIRDLLKGLASEGRTVFLSSHLMSEMEQTAEHVIVIGRGRLIADTDVAAFVSEASSGAPVRVRSPQLSAFSEVITGAGGRTEPLEDGGLRVFGLTAAQLGDLAAANRIVLHELTTIQVSLEDAFMSITKDSVEFQQHPGAETGAMPVTAGEPT
jgi:ABC-2 type transport system ATP-binding protein